MMNNLKEVSNISKMDNQALKNYCADIRSHIIEYTSINGGYLSSNLSCVEIGATIKKIFDKNDRIVYCSSDLNVINNIFASESDTSLNTLSTALGEAITRDLRHENANVVCIINSEYLRSGKAIEALNQIGAEKRKLIIVFNDDTAISQGIGLVDRFISTLRNTKTYNNLKSNVKGAISTNKNGEKLIEDIHNIKSSIKKSMIHEGIFGEYDIEYIGPVDGHNINELSRAMEIAKSKEYPVVVHCITTNGKGYKLAESNTNGAWYKVDKFDIKTGKAYAGEVDNYLFPKHVVANELNKAMMTNDRIVVLSKNILRDGVSVLFGRFVNRCILTSSDAVSLEIAHGLSKENMIPYITLNLSELGKCLEQLITYLSTQSPMLISVIKDTNDISLLGYISDNVIYGDSEDIIKDTVHNLNTSLKPTIMIIPKNCIECK